MELVVQLLLFLALLSSFLQFSHWNWKARVAFAITISLIAYFAYPWIIQQSIDDLNQWLNNPIHLLNLAVIQVVEAMFFIILDLILVRTLFGESIKKVFRWLSYFPGFVVIAAILYAEMLLFYSINQVDYQVLGLYYALFLALALFLLPLCLRWVIPESYLRMELRYVISFGQILTAMVITIIYQKIPYSQTQSFFELPPLVAVIALILVGFLAGWIWFNIKKKFTFKWKY